MIGTGLWTVLLLCNVRTAFSCMNLTHGWCQALWCPRQAVPGAFQLLLWVAVVGVVCERDPRSPFHSLSATPLTLPANEAQEVVSEVLLAGQFPHLAQSNTFSCLPPTSSLTQLAAVGGG